MMIKINPYSIFRNTKASNYTLNQKSQFHQQLYHEAITTIPLQPANKRNKLKWEEKQDIRN